MSYLSKISTKKLNCWKLSKLLKIVEVDQNCQNCKKLSKFSKMTKKNIFLSSHALSSLWSKSQWSQVSKVTLIVRIKNLSQWLSDSVSEWVTMSPIEPSLSDSRLDSYKDKPSYDSSEAWPRQLRCYTNYNFLHIFEILCHAPSFPRW